MQWFTKEIGMRANRRCVVAAALLAMGTFLFAHKHVFANSADEHAADRDAISAVLKAQQTAWNRGDVDAFLKGYWHSPELTFSGIRISVFGPGRGARSWAMALEEGER
jgi:hypothetical protein